MSDNTVMNDPKAKLWLSNYNGKPNTRNLYLASLKEYTIFTGKSPTQLIIEAKDDIKAGRFMDERAIFTDLTLFNAYLIDKGVAPKTKAARLSGVRSFFACFFIETPKLRGCGKAKPLEKNKEIPTKEDLREALRVADPLAKAVLLTGASGGLGAEEIKNLKMSDYKKGFDPITEICTLVLRREKTGVDFVTFLSAECTRAINDYLVHRGRVLKVHDSRREPQLEKQRVTTDDGYLFILHNISDKYLETRDEELRRLTKNSFTKIYTDLSMKIGKNAQCGDRNLLRSHNVRRWFNSTLINAGCDSQAVETWMGHSLGSVKEAYLRLDPAKQKEQYQKYMPFLTLEKALDISQSKEYLEIKKENIILQAETARHVVERSELREMRDKVSKLEEAAQLDSKTMEKMLGNISQSPRLTQLLTDEIRKIIPGLVKTTDDL